MLSSPALPISVLSPLSPVMVSLPEPPMAFSIEVNVAVLPVVEDVPAFRSIVTSVPASS